MTRDVVIDIMKGVAILTVIAGHCIPSDSLGHQLIFSFHMPLFFIVAGYLYKPSMQHKKRLKNDFHRLIIPYLVIAICFTLYLYIKEADNIFALRYSILAIFWATGWNHTSLIWGTAPYIGIAWFLPALFWCRQIYNFIHCHTKYGGEYIIVGLSFMAANIDYYLINLPLGILTGLSAMVFYQIGYYTHLKKTSNNYLLFGGAVCWLIQVKYFGIDMCICSYGFYPVDVIGASFATAIIYYCSKHLSQTCLGKLLGSFGKASLYIYCFHAIENYIRPYEWLALENMWYLEIPIRTAWCISGAYAYLLFKEFYMKVQKK